MRNLLGEPMGTSTAPFVVQTDEGRAYVKALGNPEGPSSLACEIIGTQLASWLGLPVFDLAVLDLPDGLCVPLTQGCHAQPGPALLAREVAGGRPWGGTEEDLQLLQNPEALSGLVVLDTWLRNRDRYRSTAEGGKRNVHNVFFSDEEAELDRYRVLAIDHSDCLRCGRDLTMRTLGISEEHEEQLYGLFPEFIPRVTRERAALFIAPLRQLTVEVVASIVGQVPREWLPSEDVRRELPGFCIRRGAKIAENIEGWLATACSWQDISPSGRQT